MTEHDLCEIKARRSAYLVFALIALALTAGRISVVTGRDGTTALMRSTLRSKLSIRFVATFVRGRQSIKCGTWELMTSSTTTAVNHRYFQLRSRASTKLSMLSLV